jgi:hypothetical protein
MGKEGAHMTHITIEKEKLQKVLEALEDLQRQYSIYPNSFWDWSKGRKAITAIKHSSRSLWQLLLKSWSTTEKAFPPKCVGFTTLCQ